MGPPLDPDPHEIEPARGDKRADGPEGLPVPLLTVVRLTLADRAGLVQA